MTTNKILVAGLIGAVVSFLLGWLVYGVLLSGFFENNLGSATGVMKADDEIGFGALVLGNLAWGCLFAIIYGRWANISTFATGAKAGAVLGGLIALYYDMIGLATNNVMNATGAMTDVIVSAVLAAITGGAVAWWLGRGEVK